MKKEFSDNRERSFSIEYMERRCAENKGTSIDDIKEYVKAHKTIEVCETSKFDAIRANHERNRKYWNSKF